MNSKIIQKMVDNYRENQLTSIKNTLGIDDAHSIWFDLPTLKKFISDIENESQKIDSSITEDSLGIRFYYAAYPNNDEWNLMKGQHPEFFENSGLSDDYSGKHTLVMVPTLKKQDDNGESLHCDFNPLDNSTYSGLPVPFANRVTDGDEPTTDVGIIAQNHGGLIPPNDPNAQIY